MTIAGLLLLAALPARAASPSAAGHLTISEFQSDTDRVAQYYGEWFELYNNYPGTLELQGVTITNDDGEVITVADSYLVAAGDYVVFGVSDERTETADDFNGNVGVDIVYAFADFNMDAPDDFLTVAYAGVTLDEVDWEAAWGISLDYAHQSSKHVTALEWANDLSSNWCSSGTFISGSGMYGSPGAENDYCGTGPGIDNDEDGYSEQEGDCDDSDENVNPGVVDGNDGVPQSSGGGGDANDDADCDGTRDDGVLDDDGDGYTEIDGDCDDTDGTIFPGAVEVEDGDDNDCNDCIDDVDSDGDGFGFSTVDTCGDDCSPSMDSSPNPDLPADSDADVNPDALETAYDGYDQDCDGLDECDYDEDGYKVDCSLVTDRDCFCTCTEATCDCDDNNAEINPGKPENNSDGVDNDCDGDIDVPDRDNDGFTEEEGDCMDIGEDATDDLDLVELSATVNPGADEICGDLLDNDCDGFYDNGPKCSNPAAFGTVRGGGFCGVTPAGGGTLALGLGALMGLLAVARRRDGGAR